MLYERFWRIAYIQIVKNSWYTIVVSGQWSVVSGQWSVVSGQWSVQKIGSYRIYQ
ncbi:hypothetical protein [Candidatus Liberibacter sp.]|uniref:hypothetical protein n=1 Tax=Candidatus Liberibacter sp. TaxID=34022 RepID=UPI0015F41E9C|nr:hypothetical protein [Candidatus Liberibacter sp.]MBA5723993.1 hypothetical protein [Candidatus Liberibacter sp.]